MLNLLLPMSGLGSRFSNAGYKLPKPLIDVNGAPMIQRVVENLNFKGTHIFLVLKEHYDKFDLKNILPSICSKNKCEIVIVEKLTEGAACTCLLAEHLINNDDQLVIANSDQIVNFNSKDFLKSMKKQKADGGIITFTAAESKWSFAKVKDNTNIITEVAEKKVISNKATVGIYWFKRGKDFVNSAKQMIKKDIRTNNEYYVCPVFNEAIENGLNIRDYPVKGMDGIGVPEDLSAYLNKCNS